MGFAEDLDAGCYEALPRAEGAVLPAAPAWNFATVVSRQAADHGMLGPSEPPLEGDNVALDPHRHSIGTLHRPTAVSGDEF